MKKLLTIIIASILLGGCTLRDLFVKLPAGLEISTNPPATVFINGENKGSTPYNNKDMKPGTYTIKMIPISESNLPSYETKLNLISKASTIISRNFAQSELDSSGYTLQLQEDLSGGTFLSVISDPDTINITIDDKPNGFTPLSKLSISPGSHSLHVTSPGYMEQAISVNVVKNYNLIVNFKLAGQTITLTPQYPATPSASLALPSPASVGAPSISPTIPKPYVVIGETGTGWLRIRKEASGSSEELGKANTGEKLKYLGESTELGWHKIEFEGAPGWVSGKYVTLIK
ncbi:hypothetical protein COT87_02155 [Candidatus Collierbacteria bacterium CG10_big_fil_rev_8_21_14_0_10_44_9]|uniref:SH3b domain-containing protein n=1 Tax=Candidatus Collierbacteria bacterium CG10_big_fil_rev_8_21_14_0_10_44_9 TaxID=1974535 RepID=A0A2H0VKT3_9BACT|nr:MAG: hypothetical protein COT87_02155 [Candidatus Collierbacteria bacterium CG10_big_fil_rev_8_21_14_0_10_44_9]